MREFVHLGYGRAWHIVATPTRLQNGYRTLCGRLIVGYPVGAVPYGGRTCKRCAKRDVVLPAEWTAP